MLIASGAMLCAAVTSSASAMSARAGATHVVAVPAPAPIAVRAPRPSVLAPVQTTATDATLLARPMTSSLRTATVAVPLTPPTPQRAAPLRVSAARPGTAVAALRVVGPTYVGRASWYGPGFQGRRTANGERFDTYQFTAAHKSLPFGTRLRVCRAGRCVVVRVNDRGPYVRGRFLDLSRAAAVQIGVTEHGVCTVTATVVAPESALTSSSWTTTAS